MSSFQFNTLFNLLFFFSTIHHILAAPAYVARDDSPTVTIASGVVIGKVSKPTNQPSLTSQANAFLGIPFAKSPPERFSPPEAAAPWSSPLQAQTVKPACIQQFSGSSQVRERTMQFFNNPLGPPPAESEDCLYLNVYTPEDSSPSSKKAVMFWLYGGNLQFGTGGLDFYDGSSLAITQDVIVVTINYRTNIFGFSNSPEIPRGSQNSGYLDQRFALQWVQDNIAQFGGDPSRVTIFGESAGGESVKQLLANPPNPLPFSAAILQSQQSLITGNGLSNYKKVLANFNCESSASPITCLRAVSATDLKQYIESEGLNFPPVDGDGTSVRDVRSSIVGRRFADVPTLFGTNLNEGRVFLAALGLNDGEKALDAGLTALGITSAAVRQSLIALYIGRGITNSYFVADRILTDAAFTCTTSSLTKFLARNGYTSYRYRYDPSFPTTSLFANSGAYHTSEIPSVFGTYSSSNQFGTATEQQIQLSSFMQQTWANFAKEPNAGVGWPSVGNAFTRELGLLGADGSAGVTVVDSLRADYPCGLYDGIGALLGLSY